MASRGSTSDEVVTDRLEMTDAEVSVLVDQARRGDEPAALKLFHYMHAHIAKIVYSNRPAREGVEDLIQQVCVKVLTNLNQFSGKVPFLHWVSRIAVNTCLNQIRREKNRPELRLADLSEEEAGVVERLAASVEELDSSQQFAASELVEKLLQGLKPPDRLVIRLMYLEGHSVEEISSLTGWSAALVKVRAFRARGLLRKRYALLMKEQS